MLESLGVARLKSKLKWDYRLGSDPDVLTLRRGLIHCEFIANCHRSGDDRRQGHANRRAG
jgi:hypothetical protein